MKRSRINLILLSITALLFVVILNDPVNEARHQSAVPISAMTADAIDSIRIESAKGQPLVMRRTGTRWHMLQPRQGVIDSNRVQALLELLNSSSDAPLQRAQVDAAELQLAPPHVSLILGQNGRQQRFDFGDHNPLNNRRYVASGKWVHQLIDRHYPLLRSKAESWLLPEAGAETKKTTP